MSTIPGSTSLPLASSVSRARPTSVPTAAMRPLAIATSASRGAPPVPSTSVPPRRSRSCMEFSSLGSGAERDLDLPAALAHRVGGRGPADRVALRAAVADVEAAAVYGALEDAARERRGVEPHHCVRTAVLDRVEAALGVADEHVEPVRLHRARLARCETVHVDDHREAHAVLCSGSLRVGRHSSASLPRYFSSVRWKCRIRTSCSPRCRLRNAAERMPAWMRGRL